MKKSKLLVALNVLDWILDLDLADTDELESAAVNVEMWSSGGVQLWLHKLSEVEQSRVVTVLGKPTRAYASGPFTLYWSRPESFDVTMFVPAEVAEMFAADLDGAKAEADA